MATSAQELLERLRAQPSVGSAQDAVAPPSPADTEAAVPVEESQGVDPQDVLARMQALSAPPAEEPQDRGFVEAAGDVAEVFTDPSRIVSESFGRGVQQEVTFNLADEMEAGFQTNFAVLQQALTGKNAFNQDNIFSLQGIAQTYQKALDKSRENLEAAEKADPDAFTAGQGTALVGTALIPGAAAVKAARGAAKINKLSKVTRALSKAGVFGKTSRGIKTADKALRVGASAGKVGAAEGFVRGVGGAKEGEKLQAGLEGGAVGLVAGSVLGAGGSALNVGRKQVAEHIKDRVAGKITKARIKAGERAKRIISEGKGFPGKLDTKIRKQLGKIEEFGEDLLNPIVDPKTGRRIADAPLGFKGAQRTHDDIQNALEEVSDIRDGMLKEIDIEFDEVVSSGAFDRKALDSVSGDVKKIAARMRKEVLGDVKKSSRGGGLSKQVEQEIKDFETFYKKGKMKISQMVDERKAIQDEIPFNRAERKPIDTAKNKMATIMNEEIDEIADGFSPLVDSANTGMMKKIRGMQNSLIIARDAAEETLKKKSRTNPFTLTDIIVGGGSALQFGGDSLLKSAAIGGAVIGAKRLAQKELPVIGAKSANTIAKFLKKIQPSLNKGGSRFAEAVGEANKLGTPAALSTHFLLFASEPEYREEIRRLAEDE